MMEIASLEKVCRTVRRDIINMTADAASGHPGGSLSAVEIITTLFFDKMNIDPQNPKKADRDRFVLSKGHAAPVSYTHLDNTIEADSTIDNIFFIFFLLLFHHMCSDCHIV